MSHPRWPGSSRRPSRPVRAITRGGPSQRGGRRAARCDATRRATRGMTGVRGIRVGSCILGSVESTFCRPRLTCHRLTTSNTRPRGRRGCDTHVRECEIDPGHRTHTGSTRATQRQKNGKDERISHPRQQSRISERSSVARTHRYLVPTERCESSY